MTKQWFRRAASLFAALLFLSQPARALEVSARSALVMDSGGQILWEKNSRERSLIASTTKIMTALLVLERADPAEIVEVPPEAAGIEGSSMYLKAGEKLTVEDLLYGLMLSSGNDAAAALAIHVSGSCEAFAGEMNRKAASLGLSDTHFENPHGLDGENNYSTARDLARLGAHAMENEHFRRIVSTRSHRVGDRYLVSHNKLLWQYPGALGVKTGYTKRAGRLLVGCAERNGRRLISVTISAPDDWNDHRAMLDYGFSLYEEKTLVEAGQIVGSVPVISGTESRLMVRALEPVSWNVLPGEEPELRLLVRPFYYAPVRQGEILGTLQVFLGGKLVGQVPAAADSGVNQAAPSDGGFLEHFR